MGHSHTFEVEPSADGFEGLGKKESESTTEQLADLVYYMQRDCTYENCSATEYRSWLFAIDSFEMCCDDVLPEEPTELLEASLQDFRGLDQPVVVTFTCTRCGDSQTVTSDHIYTVVNT